MLTINDLKNYGADVSEGLGRCLNNEGFYIKLVLKTAAKLDTSELEAALADRDLGKAFDICHAMKGVTGNLSLSPIYKPVSEMTELLRAKSDIDYSGYISEIKENVRKLKDICL